MLNFQIVVRLLGYQLFPQKVGDSIGIKWI